ncbi:MAG: C39 family peptidase [Bacteriovoracaceae bacterium]|nr:C39 family peptidase [Bacteriovoracaceae bacterium]
MKKLKLKILPQPDNTTCGPTSLHAIYQFWGHKMPLDQIISEIRQFEKGGGTLAVILAKHAIAQGFNTTIISYNLRTFDPTWFGLSNINLVAKLKMRLARKKHLTHKDKIALMSYIEYLELGGSLKFIDLSPKVILNLLNKNIPILAGLSATWLYQTQREQEETTEYNDIIGDPAGHFVVLYGHDKASKLINIADPYVPNPIGGQHYYRVTAERLITSILLGVMTYDGNLLLIGKKKKTRVKKT